MKKLFLIALVLCFTVIIVSACGRSAAPAVTPAPAAVPTAEPTSAPPAETPAPVAEEEEDLPREPSLVFARDLFDGYGFVHQQCDVSGLWGFNPVNSDGITWKVYILDREFEDAERFIPQAYPLALEGSGTLTLEAGQWIYVYCPCNSWTMDEAPEGCAFSWGLA